MGELLSLYVQAVVCILCTEVKNCPAFPTVSDKAVVSGTVSDGVRRSAGGRAAVESLADRWTEALIGHAAAVLCTERDPGQVHRLPLQNKGYHLQERRKAVHYKHYHHLK